MKRKCQQNFSEDSQFRFSLNVQSIVISELSVLSLLARLFLCPASGLYIDFAILTNIFRVDAIQYNTTQCAAVPS